MSHTASRAVFRHSASKGSARLVLLAMADEASSSGALTAYHRSYGALAAKANVDEGTVRRSIRALVELGELRVLAVGDGRRSSDYQLVLPELDEGVQAAHPGPAGRTPSVGQMHTLGVQPAHPIIPLLPGTSPVPPTAAPAGPTFEDFYRAYPRHEGVGAARTAWAKAIKKADPAAILAGAQRYAADPNRSPEFTKTPGPWLNAERWADEPLPPRAQQRGGQAPRRIDTDRSRPSGVVNL